MVVTISVNVGTEASPTWVTLTSSKAIWFGDTATTASTYVPVKINPSIPGVAPAPVAWIADYPTYGSGQKINTYVRPDALTQYKNVIRASFSVATTAPPKVTAWKRLTGKTSTDCEALNGTTLTSDESLIKLIETTITAPSVNWCTYTTASLGYTQVNALRGNDNYVSCASNATAGGTKLFAIACWVPSDLSVSFIALTKDFELVVEELISPP